MTEAETALRDIAERVRAATGPDRELDFDIGKALGAIPVEARWMKLDDEDPLMSSFFTRDRWEMPLYRDAKDTWKARMEAFIGSEEYYKSPGNWVENNPPPGESADWVGASPEGRVVRYTASIDAALGLVERMRPGLGTPMLDNAIHAPTSSGVMGDYKRLPLAILAALLSSLTPPAP